MKDENRNIEKSIPKFRNMTILEVQHLRNNLNDKINELIKEFEKNTDLEISAIGYHETSEKFVINITNII